MQIVLVGTFGDKPSVVSQEMIDEFMGEWQSEHHFVVSSATGEGVSELFETVARIAIDFDKIQ